MKTEDRSGDQFAAAGALIENKALRINDTIAHNAEQASRFARTDEERRAIQLEALKAKARDLDGRDREAGEGSPDETATPDGPPATEDAPCSD